MPVLVNLARLSSDKWGPRQRAHAACLADTVVDILVPATPLDLDDSALQPMCDALLDQVPAEAVAAIVWVEPAIAPAIVAALRARGIRCFLTVIGPTPADRNAERFLRFRPYLGDPPLPPGTFPAAEPAPEPPATAAEKPAPAIPAAATAPPPPPARHNPRASRGHHLRQIRFAARVGDRQQLAEAHAAFLEDFPGQEAIAADAEREGIDLKRQLVAFEQLLARARVDSPHVNAEVARLDAAFPYAKEAVRKRLAFARNREQQREDAKAGWAEGGPRSTVKAAGDHRISALAPALEWRLWIDETGDRFGTTGSKLGRVVGLLLPKDEELPPIDPAFHAASRPVAQVDAAVQAVLDHPGCGVFGIAVDALPETPGERWSDVVLEVVAWVARLAPLPAEGRMSLDVRVEQRGGFDKNASWELGVRQVLARLTEVAPERARRLDLTIRTVPKGTDRALAYVDALAYTWGSRSPESQDRLRASGLAGACFVALPAALRAPIWAAWDGARPPEGHHWRALVTAAARSGEGSFLERLLEQLAELAQSTPEVWAGWVEAASHHLESKAIDLGALGREVGWLAATSPPEAALPDRLRLLWSVARLAEANHRGELRNEELEQTLAALSERLFDEDARLVCLADLHRAVTLSHHLDPDRAQQVLARWSALPPAVPGLQYWARVRSSVGQHHAFRGELPAARVAFREAIAAFGRLSDPAVARSEQAQTGAYLAIACMDDPTVPVGEARQVLEQVIGPLEGAIGRLAGSRRPDDKYAQHLLVRWLAARGSGEERERWAQTWESWEDGYGHPWQLVAFYRAALLAEVCGPAAQPQVHKWARRAAELAEKPGQGWAIRLICATIGVAATRWGIPWDRAEDRLKGLRTHLPGANVDALEAFLKSPGDPLPLAARVLPFNFR